MISWTLSLAFLLLAAAKEPESAADAVTLRDGTVVLGQVVEPSPRGALTIIARRAWAEKKWPELAKRWEAAEEPALRRAAKQRRERYAAWSRERSAHATADDRIVPWLDSEVARLADEAGPTRTPLMTVRLNRAEVRSIARRPKATARMLRQGWLSGFADVETMSLADLKEALEGRGFAPGGESPVAIDELLPTPSESDVQWQARRAATEVANDEGLRFVQSQGMVYPEPAAGQAPALGGVAGLVGDLKKLLGGDNDSDPLMDRLHEVAARGRAGAVVTRLDIEPSLDAVNVETALWVRNSQERWSKLGWRTARVRTDELDPKAGDDLADDPQIQAVFQIAESLGLGQVAADVKKKSLNMGAATRKALGLARSALADDLARLELPVQAVARPAPKPPEKP